MHYAATHGVRAPKVLGLYKIKTTKPSKTVATALVSERVPGMPLEDVWLDLNVAEQSSIKAQLRSQFECLRQCTQPFIGRINNQELPNIYALFANTTTCGPFQDEKSFDNWCIDRLLTRNPITRFNWRKRLASERRHSSGRFVLTHGDLSPANIMVDKGIVTGIIDWDRSGFYPEYAEYAFAIGLYHNHEDWWLEVLKEVLQPCSLARLQFTYLVQDKFPEQDWRKELTVLRDNYAS